MPAMKPRWKTLVELALGLVFLFVGASLGIDSLQGELMFDVLPAWLGFLCGLLISWYALDRIHDRWGEL